MNWTGLFIIFSESCVIESAVLVLLSCQKQEKYTVFKTVLIQPQTNVNKFQCLSNRPWSKRNQLINCHRPCIITYSNENNITIPTVRHLQAVYIHDKQSNHTITQYLYTVKVLIELTEP